jgi:hypothetical protein
MKRGKRPYELWQGTVQTFRSWDEANAFVQHLWTREHVIAFVEQV